MPEWTADIEVPASLAADMISRQHPILRPVHIETLGEGWDNHAFLVNRRYVFRFPRRAFAVPLLETEMRVLPHVAPRLPVPVSAPAFIGKPCGDFPYPFAGYPYIKGQMACHVALTDADRIGLARSLGLFLKALHGISTKEALASGAGNDTIRRLDFLHRLPKTLERVGYLVAHNLLEDATRIRAMVQNAPAEYMPRSDTLLHGDLYSRHILLDDEHRLAGIIDWGDTHLGDPATDLMVAFTFPPRAREGFFEAYGPVPAMTCRVARSRGLFHSLAVAVYAHSTPDPQLLAASLLAIRNAAETDLGSVCILT